MGRPDLAAEWDPARNTKSPSEVTTRSGTVRLSVHASTDDETLQLLRSAFASYRSAASL